MLLTASGLSFGAINGTLNVEATVDNVCMFTSSNPHTLNFGTYNPADPGDLFGTTIIDILCTTGATWSIELSGINGAISRQMTNGDGDILNYELYQNATRTLEWSSIVPKPGTGTGFSHSNTVYGTIPLGQNVPADTYSTSEVITVTF